jgi:hypothetical protein
VSLQIIDPEVTFVDLFGLLKELIRADKIVFEPRRLSVWICALSINNIEHNDLIEHYKNPLNSNFLAQR